MNWSTMQSKSKIPPEIGKLVGMADNKTEIFTQLAHITKTENEKVTKHQLFRNSNLLQVWRLSANRQGS